MTLPYSDAIFVCAFPRECTEAFLEGHVRAFEFFGGVPRRISYDNLQDRRRQDHRRPGPRRSPTRSSGSRAITCSRPTSAWCGGPTRRGTSRRWSASPAATSSCRSPPCTAAWSRSTQRLAAGCREDLARRPAGQAGDQGRAARRGAGGLPAAAGRGVRRPPGSSRPACRLAVAGPLRRQRLLGADRVRPPRRSRSSRRSTTSASSPATAWSADHRRCWGRERVTYDPVHYLALLERKPGALDFAAPLEGWELPVCFGVLRRRLEAEFGGPGTRQYIKVLRLLERAEPRRADPGGRAGAGAGRRRRRRGAADPGAPARAAGRAVLPRRPAAPQAGGRADARPVGLREPDGGGGAMKKLETTEHGAAEAPPQGAEAADDDRRVREGGGPVRQGERRPPRVPAPALRAGAARARAAGGGPAAEGGAVPDAQGAGRVRLRGGAVGEQAADPGADEVRVHRASRERPPGRRPAARARRTWPRRWPWRRAAGASGCGSSG